MNKAILICGKICSGKTTYAKRLLFENKAVLLSVDEILLAIFGQHIGEKHDEIADKTEIYLLEKSIEIINSGIDVILDWGFWTNKKRKYASMFYKDKGINIEWHYIDINDIIWHKNIITRNNKIENGQDNNYFIDENIANKFNNIFEMPKKEEFNVWHINDWD